MKIIIIINLKYYNITLCISYKNDYDLRYSYKKSTNFMIFWKKFLEIVNSLLIIKF